MRVFIAGNKGQLGRALAVALRQHEVVGGDLPELDIAAYDVVRNALAAVRPDVVINAAAYTDTTGCERNPELAFVARDENAHQSSSGISSSLCGSTCS